MDRARNERCYPVHLLGWSLKQRRRFCPCWLPTWNPRVNFLHDRTILAFWRGIQSAVRRHSFDKSDCWQQLWSVRSFRASLDLPSVPTERAFVGEKGRTQNCWHLNRSYLGRAKRHLGCSDPWLPSLRSNWWPRIYPSSHTNWDLTDYR
jgi:hypothetical protein